MKDIDRRRAGVERESVGKSRNFITHIIESNLDALPPLLSQSVRGAIRFLQEPADVADGDCETASMGIRHSRSPSACSMYRTTVTSETAIRQPPEIIVSSAVIILLIFSSSSTMAIMMGSSLESASVLCR